MKQLKAQLQEALATGRLIARFGKSLFVQIGRAHV